MLSLQNISVNINGREILKDVNFQISDKQKIGLVGRNGSGKSTIFKLIQDELHQDTGKIDKSKNWLILSVKQEMPSVDMTPLEFVLSQDLMRAELFKQLETCDDCDIDLMSEIYAKLEDIDAYSAEGRAAKILKGLGFSEEAQNKTMNHFSGGFRMRVALASVLFQTPDLLLLDEPTNHLDLETTEWLKDFLSKYPKSFILISHERDFLNETVNYILSLKNGKVEMYKGNFDNYLKLFALKQKNIAAFNEKMESKKQSMLEFVKRFGAKATKAKQAQSRLKMIEKMEFIEVEESDPTIAFNFPDCIPASYPLLDFSKVTIGYDERPILHNATGIIGLHDRIALVGQNGNGKTTLAKFLAGELASMKGSVKRDNKFKVAFYKQDQKDQLNFDQTLFDYIAHVIGNYNNQIIRAHLARFGFGPEHIEQRIGQLSGGEKARLLLAGLTVEKPNLLILDEPTNHLDMEMRQSLMMSLNNYNGAVILITHDKYLLRGVADQIWLVNNKQLTKLDEDIEHYEF